MNADGQGGSVADDRTVLPVPRKPSRSAVGLTYEDTPHSLVQQTTAPRSAPNIVIVLLDDVGFGAAGTFGGPVPTPTADKLAAAGLRYNRFHTTALCSPSRAALITGRNHHAVGSGCIAEYATSWDGYNSIIPDTAATVAETLRLNGYSTAAYGKWHNTPVWEVSPIGPFDRWPTGLGFEEFYGFVAGETHQYFPGLYHGTTPVERPEGVENYHLTTDLADHAIAWMSSQKSLAPDKPFFVYFAPGATHAPHHIYPEWWEPFKGQFDQGWDRLREETFARQKALGVVPADAELTPRPPETPAFDSFSDDQQAIATRLMEIYAGFLHHADHEAGRLVAAIEDLGIWDDTLFIYIIGDNGAAAAGGIYGVFNEMVAMNGLQEDPEVVLSKIDEFGGPKASNEYPVGFAWALNTPFQWTKQIASHFGGTRNPMLISWPRRITDAGGLRSQFHHLVDVVPTLLEAAGLPLPKIVNGVDQQPMDGVSLAYTFDDADTPEARTTQYFEIMGSRGIYHDGWMACTYHDRVMWAPTPPHPFEEDRWELYHIDEDFTQANDLAAKEPERLRELQELFFVVGSQNNVFPLDDRPPSRIAGDPRPTVLGDRTNFSFGAGAVRMPEDLIRSTFNKSYSIKAEINVPETGDLAGVIVTAGGYFAGFSLYVMEGRPKYTYNYFGSTYTSITGEEPLPAGDVTIRYEFTYDGGGIGKGGKGALFVNDTPVGTMRLEATVPLGFTGDETLDVGLDTGTPAAEDYACPFPFTGSIKSVRFDIAAE